MRVAIRSLGHFIPETRLTNDELSLRLGVTKEWIEEKTGIIERRIFLEGATSDMIVRAVEPCLKKINCLPSEIECVIVATMTPDYHCPSTAAAVHHKLRTNHAWGFDLMAACSGFIYGLQVATGLINSKIHKKVLLCAADMFSSIVDPEDRKTSVIFADGAGVAILEYCEDEQNDIIDTVCKLDSTHHMAVRILSGGSANSISHDAIGNRSQYLRFTGKGLFDIGVELLVEVMLEILNKNNMSFDDIDYIVPHQANKRMLEVLAQTLNVPIAKFLINIEYIGNTSCASIPIVLSEMAESNMLIGNKKLLLTAVGAGFTYAASIITIKNL